MFLRLRPMAALAAVLLLPILNGCGKNAVAPKPAPDPLADLPVATSPQNAVLALKWCHENLSTAGYRRLFTEDFVFHFGAADTNGNRYTDGRWGREEELLYLDHLRNGDPATGMPRVVQLTLLLDGTLRVTDDTRPGRYDPERRKMIRTSVTLHVTDESGMSINIFGKALFYLVRGDSARIPPELEPASTASTWYIERWEDETLVGGLTASSGATSWIGPAAAQPTRAWTWGALKALYAGQWLASGPSGEAAARR